MNITKDQFVKLIDSVTTQINRDVEIGQSLTEVTKDGGGYNAIFSTPLVESVVSALDYDGIISWWLWDGPQAGKKAEEFAIYLGDADDENTKRLAIHDAGELYDYMEGQLDG